ncbi:TPA: ParB/RepB/Spo0J family partition protein [Burkholderia cenocepacia]|uniref:ParB/RepB/Spo0J family partition protein n=1 Tax=Burkholderia cenocepacia TaxID=95486 RepID=UPI000841EB73|nr:ParB N-terminal domain-containing protein [Burkholderia cenocepacia]AOJ21987.1 pyridoxal phosphate biosynthetic protein PdxJ [Burkholderia cenocepacia]MBR8195716.1 ParB/RepB/Spo0J family partition protein [Burkholderia cenocepacia]HDV6325459.1 ParB/RepB/Spo0J family partition protein [Burkholderia cenocepacia]HDV6351415.1 ParB/RepB/Spo0J family partition protein [Burkholderia cenocepacia]
MDDRTQQLDLTAPIPTGNIKAAAAAAGATSADLWMVPYDQLHYDPSDNIRPVDPEWVAHLAALMRENGYDKGSPLHCYARKVDGKDLLYVYKGQHRYLAAGHAIATGKDLGKIPVVVRDAKNVNRAEMVIDGYLSNNGKPSSPLDLAVAVAELRDIHGMTLAAICKRLDVTDQTIRDVALLERAPVELHQLVRKGQCTGTLAIEQIRQHGGEKALERIVAGIAKAAEAGKTKVTKKYLEATPLLDTHPDSEPSREHTAPAAADNDSDAAPLAASTTVETTIETQAPMQAASRQSVPAKISEKQSKQLLQALQAVLHDKNFGRLAKPTIEAVHSALIPLADLLGRPSSTKIWPLSEPDANGCCQPVDTVCGPERTGRIKGPLAYIRVAQPAPGTWIYAIEYNTGTSFASDPLKVSHQTRAVWTRVQAIRSGAARLIETIKSPVHGRTKAEQASFKRILEWAHEIVGMPDPDMTAEFSAATAKGERPDLSDVLTAIGHKQRIASNRALLDAAFPTYKAKLALGPASAWPFPTGAAN